MPVFICTRCGHREAASDRHVRHQPRGCSRCGFGFLFELLEDYYPSPKTGLLACDSERRVLAIGLATTAVTGFREQDLLGQEVMERLGISGYEGGDPAERALEWGVRVLDLDCTFRPRGSDTDTLAKIDFFPAYDDDGGLLVAITPS
ncbi:MAG: hypothetical protein OEM67_08750 [Thermoleophilia bacterium]|nr:hypothetical protein [Thermoleophilia bacterium]MDH3725519.1 hypothetical protein [Thermoleophilia bacterium]